MLCAIDALGMVDFLHADSKKRFKKYIRTRLPSLKDYATEIYDIFRCGIAHSLGSLPLVGDERQRLTSRVDIGIVIADIAKVGLAELPVGVHAGCHRLGQRDRDVSMVAFKDLLGTEIPSIGNRPS